MTTYHYLPKSMTDPELELIRSEDQSSKLYLGILKPTVVYTARVNQSFSSKDKVVEVVYDSGSGTLADVISGMTMYIGSTAGTQDIGLVRIRKEPDGSKFYIGENSDITWIDNLYLTVVDDFNLWARHISIASNVPYMDYDIAYSDQHTNTLPIPIIGPRLVPTWILPQSISTKYNQNDIDLAASFVGGGWYYDGSPAAAPSYMGDWMITGNNGDYFEFTFSGKNIVEVIAPLHNIGGIVDVYLDGVLDVTVDLYSATTHWQQVIYSKDVSLASHTIRVASNGKNPLSGGYYNGLDAVQFYSTPRAAEVPWDASLSYCLPDTSVSSYLWTAPGSFLTLGLSTATPTIYYDTPGTYLVSCKITAANGNFITAYAHVLVYDREDNQPVTQFDLKSCNGSYNDAGWKFQITMWAEAELSSVVDRAQVVIFARDFYETTEVSIGQVPNRNNILATGWINGESIVEDPDGSSVGFTVETAEAWIKRLSGFPIGIQNKTATADAWTNWFNLNVDASLYHLFYWQATVIPVIDVFLTGDSRKSAEQYASGDTSIFDQLTYLLKNTLLGSAGCDRFSRLFCEIDVQLTPPSERSVFPVVLQLEKIDWRDKLPISRIVTNTTSQVNLSGVIIDPPAAVVPVFSLAPGHVYTPLGKPIKQDRLLLSSQSQGNELAAMKLAWDNHNLEFSPDLAGNNRMLDVFPSHQYVGIDISDIDTPRGFVFSGSMIVREISMSFEQSSEDATGFLQISWNGEQEVYPGNSCDGDLPATSDVPTTDFPPVGPTPIPLPPIISTEPVDPQTLNHVVILVEGVGVFYTDNFSAPNPGDVIWFSMNEGFPNNTYSPQIVSIDVSFTGRCFCQVSNDSIWSAPEPGAPWELVFDTLMVGNPEGYPFPRDPKVISFGINRDADDELLITAGVTVTISPSFIMYNWYGNSSSVSLVTPAFFDIGDPNIIGFSNYGDGLWAVSYSSGTEKVVTFGNNGATLIVAHIFGGTLTVPIMTRGRYASQTLCLVEPTALNISQDNGATFTSYPLAPTPYPGAFSLDTDPEGLNILLGTALVGMKSSVDGGTTWNPTSTLAAVTAIENLGTTIDWIFAFVGQVCYTPDFGVTFIYRTGDLQTWAGPFCIVKMIRYYQ